MEEIADTDIVPGAVQAHVKCAIRDPDWLSLG